MKKQIIERGKPAMIVCKDCNRLINSEDIIKTVDAYIINEHENEEHAFFYCPFCNFVNVDTITIVGGV